jgi:hypothetical protein
MQLADVPAGRGGDWGRGGRREIKEKGKGLRRKEGGKEKREGGEEEREGRERR